MSDTVTMNPNELFPTTARFRSAFPVAELKSDEPTVPPDVAFCANIKRYGVLTPLAIRENGEVICGRRRYLACIKAEIKTVPVMIYPDDMAGAHVMALVENVARKGNPVNELHHVERLMKEAPPYTFDRIKSEIPGMTSQKLNRLLAIKQGLLPTLRRAFNDGVIVVSVAEALAKRPKDFQRDMLEILEEDGELPLSAVKEAAKITRKATVAALPGDLFTTQQVSSPLKMLLEEAQQVATNTGKGGLANRIAKLLEGV